MRNNTQAEWKRAEH